MDWRYKLARSSDDIDERVDRSKLTSQVTDPMASGTNNNSNSLAPPPTII